MNSQIEHALKTDRLIDITTIGKKSGKPSKIEIAFHNFGGQLYISGLPGKRDWYANLLAHPDFTFHLKQSAVADLPARATPITDPEARKQILSQVVTRWNRQPELEAFLKSSPLVQVQLLDNKQTTN